MIANLLQEPQYDFVRDSDKQFIIAFDDRMKAMGYTCEDKIVDGVCYGKYMMIYRKANVKSRKVYARIYMRCTGVVLRFFFSNVTSHAAYIISAKPFMQAPFIGEYARCNYCRGEECKFRKSYEINSVHYDKCNGLTFEFADLSTKNMDDYIAMFAQFNSNKKSNTI